MHKNERRMENFVYAAESYTAGNAWIFNKKTLLVNISENAFPLSKKIFFEPWHEKFKEFNVPQ